jgi:Na+/H+ antiporter NhaD/arsenite permease-like protein
MLPSFRKDPVLYCSAAAALVTVILMPFPSSYLAFIDFRVLSLLFSLMVVTAGLTDTGFFDRLVRKLLDSSGGIRMLSLTLTGACFFASMLITNDVSLITFVPLSVLLLEKAGRKNLLIPVIVLQTLAANLGSMFTPMGNPQNLYLYVRSGMSAFSFLKLMAPVTFLSLLLLILSVFLLVHPDKKEGSGTGRNSAAASGTLLDRRGRSAERVFKSDSLPWLILFLICVLSVSRVLHYGVALAVVSVFTLLTNRKILLKADYSLLLTFVFFFIFTGNMGRIPAVSSFLSSAVNGREMTIGILLSQFISNVPAAMLLSGFTQNFTPLILGVDIGGLGTLIASMASLISYKIYIRTEDAKPSAYLCFFTVMNVICLVILSGAAFFLTRQM